MSASESPWKLGYSGFGGLSRMSGKFQTINRKDDCVKWSVEFSRTYDIILNGRKLTALDNIVWFRLNKLCVPNC